MPSQASANIEEIGLHRLLKQKVLVMFLLEVRLLHSHHKKLKYHSNTRSEQPWDLAHFVSAQSARFVRAEGFHLACQELSALATVCIGNDGQCFDF